MRQYQNHPEYAAIAAKIKRRSRIITAVTAASVLLALLLCLPGEFIFMDKPVAYEGAHPVVTVLIIAAIIIASLVALAITALPSVNSLEVECDPEKHLCINVEMGSRNIELTFATDLFLLGDFENSLSYSKRLIESKSKVLRYDGYLFKARNEFFLGDTESLKATVAEVFREYENDSKKPNPKVLGQMLDTLSLFVALTDDNREEIERFYERYTQDGTQSRLSSGLYNYVKGLAAHRLGLKNEYIHHFMAVKDACPKTILASFAAEYLAQTEEIG